MLDRTDISRNVQQLADSLMADVDGARAALVATPDGFDLARAGEQTVDAGRLAAMVSSLSALGDAASRETQIGQPRCLVIDSSDGRLVVRSMQFRGEPLIVVLLTDTAALLGMVLNALNAADRQLSNA